ncbi:MAG: hypothetical protein JXR84_08350 [Anaerolineae bacterium]|nr:hypothetical protein [Anaerolineae bacterium]
MVLDAVMFLSGAVLFLLAVLFSIYLWIERGATVKRRAALAGERQEIQDKNIELEIWQKELRVWHDALDHEERQLEQEREEFRMLVASHHLANERVLTAPRDLPEGEDDEVALKEDHWGKNLKHTAKSSTTTKREHNTLS